MTAGSLNTRVSTETSRTFAPLGSSGWSTRAKTFCLPSAFSLASTASSACSGLRAVAVLDTPTAAGGGSLGSGGGGSSSQVA